MEMQVVLPLLQNEVVATGWVSEQDFLTGFALVQAMPGPLFNFAAYLGLFLWAKIYEHCIGFCNQLHCCHLLITIKAESVPSAHWILQVL